MAKESASLSSLGAALVAAGVTGTMPTAEPVAPAPVAPAPAAAPSTSARTVALRYDDSQSFAFWTANNAESKADALWSALAPMLSAYLVSGGTVASLKGAAGASRLASYIHSNKGKRNTAARAVFAECLQDYKPRQFSADQSGHDDALSVLCMLFQSALVSNGAGKPRNKVQRYTITELCEALASGQVSADDVALIRAALPSPVASAQREELEA